MNQGSAAKTLLAIVLTGWALSLAAFTWLEGEASYGAEPPLPKPPIPDKIVVLTFDDSVKSHYTIVRPILRKYKFGATFFITEGFDFAVNKRDYMTWEEIAELHRDGFEIGNHTRDHLSIRDSNAEQLAEQINAIQNRCREHDIPAPVSFAWPGNAIAPAALDELRKLGIRFARRGGQPERTYERGEGFAYEPAFDHPLLIPTAGDARPDWEMENFIAAVRQAELGRIAVLQFHGVPDSAHPWVNTSPDKFDAYMKYLAIHDYKAIALRDVEKYVDPDATPSDWQAVVKDRIARDEAGLPRTDFRKPPDNELDRWIRIMHWHRFTPAEMRMATGMSQEELTEAAERIGVSNDATPSPRLLPYPGGRHPRISFLDGAVRPQRETKVSVFTPWKDGGYVVVDVPEAVWMQTETSRELLYLAHTHVPTVWSKSGVELKPLEWAEQDGELAVERRFPNGVRLAAKAIPTNEGARFELFLSNGTDQMLRGLVVQNCVMLKGAPGFQRMTTDNKTIERPYVACRHETEDRWIITAWENCVRPWANAPCPCMHSDPQFPDCPPGETRTLRGWLSFYEGSDIRAEFRRIAATGWDAEPAIPANRPPAP